MQETIRRLARTQPASHSPFGLDSADTIISIAAVARAARQDRLAMHVEDVLNGNIQSLNLYIPIDRSAAELQGESDAPSVFPAGLSPEDIQQMDRDGYWVESDDANDRMYAVASLSKIYLAAALILQLRENEFLKSHDVNLFTDAYSVYNLCRNRWGLPLLLFPEKGPRLWDILCHTGALAPMNKYILGPDSSHLLTRDQFLRIAMQITTDMHEQLNDGRPWYSSANHIFLGILLEAVMQKDLWEVVQKCVFERFRMTNSSFHKKALLEKEVEQIVRGAMVSSHGTRHAVDAFSHLDGIVQYAAMGVRSSLRDIAKFNRELIGALAGKQGSVILTDDARALLGDPVTSPDGRPTTPYGYREVLGKTMFSESPNAHLNPGHHTLYQIKIPKGEKPLLVFRKAGYIDGFGCNVILIPKLGISIIVLGNASGPIDTTYHVANYILQAIVQPAKPVDILGLAVSEGKLCAAALQQIEKPAWLTQSPGLQPADLAGTYRHEHYEQEIVIDRQHNVTIRGDGGKSSPGRLVSLTNDMIAMDLPVSKCGIEVWSVWRDRRFSLTRGPTGLTLVQAGTNDVYLLVE